MNAEYNILREIAIRKGWWIPLDINYFIQDCINYWNDMIAWWKEFLAWGARKKLRKNGDYVGDLNYPRRPRRPKKREFFTRSISTLHRGLSLMKKKCEHTPVGHTHCWHSIDESEVCCWCGCVRDKDDKTNIHGCYMDKIKAKQEESKNE